MDAYLAEFIGTALLVLFGNGVVANVLLSKTNGHDSGWIVIAAGWGIAVFIGAFCSERYSGAHLNPAVTVAVVTAGKLPVESLFGYIAAQMLGAMLGAFVAYLFYIEHFRATSDSNVKLACFCNSPQIRNLPQALFCEVVGTYALILPIFLMVAPSLDLATADGSEPPVLGLGTIGLLPVGLLVFGIGLSLGGPTGYAINPARDLSPRIVHFLLPIRGKRDSDWGYSWVPVAGPLLGGVLAAMTFKLLGI